MIIDKFLLMIFLVVPCILVQLQFSYTIAPTYSKNCKKALEQTIILFVLYSEQTSYHFFMFEQSSSNTGIYSYIDTEQLCAQSDTQTELLHTIMCPRNRAKKYRQYRIAPILTVSLYYNYICLSGIVLLSASQPTYAICIQHLKLLSRTHYAYFLIYRALPS